MAEKSSPEPFNVFSSRIDPGGVLEVLLAMATEVVVVGPPDNWSKLIVRGPRRLLAKRSQLTISHDSSFYQRSDWPRYIQGLANYVAGFETTPRTEEILRVVQRFRFILAFPECDLTITGREDRVAWVQSICRHLDGLIFTPSMLLDASGRLLTAINGDFDPAARLPLVPGSTEASEAEAANSERLQRIDASARARLCESTDEDPGLIDEEDLDAEPATAELVAQRAVILAAVGNRGLLETELKSVDAPEMARQALVAWIEGVGVSDEVEGEEWRVLQRPSGRLEGQATTNSVWRLEGLGVLLWALQLYELPAYDELVTPTDLFDRIGIFDVLTARQVIATAKLRPADELESFQRHALMTHWRFRNFTLRPTPVNFVEMAAKSWFVTFDIKRFRIAENDVMVGDRPIAKADPERIRIGQSIAMERHTAINWVMDASCPYSEVDTST